MRIIFKILYGLVKLLQVSIRIPPVNVWYGSDCPVFCVHLPHYMQTHNKVIEDYDQPLLVSRPRKKVREDCPNGCGVMKCNVVNAKCVSC